MNIEQGSLTDLENKVALWANERGLVKQEFSFRQLAKTMEELGEVAGALCRDKQHEFRDGIGDVMVCLIILARQNNTTIQECLWMAYREIKSRKGETINGTFIKEEDLQKAFNVVMPGVPKIGDSADKTSFEKRFVVLPMEPLESEKASDSIHQSEAGEVLIPSPSDRRLHWCDECDQHLSKCDCI